MFETLLHINCKGSNFIDSSIMSDGHKGKATILGILELTEHKLPSTPDKYQH